MTNPQTLLTLPAEIRLQIWDLVFTHTPYTRHPQTQELVIDPRYSSSTQLNTLLVCRQIHNEVGAGHAFQQTTFIIRHSKGSYPNFDTPLEFPTSRIANLKHLVLPTFRANWKDPEFLHFSPLLQGNVHLSTLTLFFFRGKMDFTQKGIVNTVHYLRNVQNVEIIRFMRNASSFRLRRWYRLLIGQMLKEDHYERYDAKAALNIEKTWWEWRFDKEDQVLEFVARPPKPIMEEEEYMGLVAPLIKALTDDMEAEDEESVVNMV
ncbi:hypothetical protein CC80DRAFT_488327 [Byssothecium circinans]|uniref:Uncharacterized protein n=1 Tax=Byssothecium circinans TaxID=147558 RepID=A0A6A5UAL6_9PLEO|nr:hypothetical protein CC80DRAFT_488327 [Byssothecium circinans]